MPPKFQFGILSANRTLYPNELFTVHQLECTSAANLTLCAASANAWVMIANCGSEIITVKDGSTVICTLEEGEYCMVYALLDQSTYLAQWPDSVPVFALSGRIRTTGAIVVDSTSNALTLLDTAGHYWLITVDTLGNLVTTDNGLTPPV